MLTDQEKERVRYHLGYMETSFGSNQAAASLQLGIPRPAQTVFLLEEAISALLTNTYALDRVRKILCVLDGMEEKIAAAACQLTAESIGDIKLRANLPDLLEREYVRWARRLADILGVPIYPFSMRFRNPRSINVSVRG